MKKGFVIIHHSATPDGQTFSWGSIRKFHVVERKWRNIGYHLGTELVGDAYENILGRDWDDVGAHCPEGGMNVVGLGWCIVGNYDLTPPSEALWKHIVGTARYLSRYLDIHATNFIGHGEAQKAYGVQTKSCPGKFFNMDRLRAEIS